MTDVNTTMSAQAVWNVDGNPASATYGQQIGGTAATGQWVRIADQGGVAFVAGTAAPSVSFSSAQAVFPVRAYTVSSDGVNFTATRNAIAPVVDISVTAKVIKASAGTFQSGAMLAGATAGFFILYDAAAAPAGGASLTTAQILAAVPVAANGYATIGSDGPVGDKCANGGVLLFSTAVTTYTVPANAAVHMRGRMY